MTKENSLKSKYGKVCAIIKKVMWILKQRKVVSELRTISKEIPYNIVGIDVEEFKENWGKNGLLNA